MSLQFDEVLRNTWITALATAAGTSPIIDIYSGILPYNCAAVATGTRIASFQLPATWMTTALGGSGIVTVPQNSAILASGAPSYFRLFNASRTLCVMQGTVGIADADLIVTVATASTGQVATLSSLTINAPGA